MTQQKTEQRRQQLIWVILLICSFACMVAIAEQLYIYLHQAEPMVGVTVKGSNGSELTIAPTGGTTTVKSPSGATLEIGFSSFGPPTIAPITSPTKVVADTKDKGNNASPLKYSFANGEAWEISEDARRVTIRSKSSPTIVLALKEHASQQVECLCILTSHNNRCESGKETFRLVMMNGQRVGDQLHYHAKSPGQLYQKLNDSAGNTFELDSNRVIVTSKKGVKRIIQLGLQPALANDGSKRVDGVCNGTVKNGVCQNGQAIIPLIIDGAPLPIGGNVHYHPVVKLPKITTDPDVYKDPSPLEKPK